MPVVIIWSLISILFIIVFTLLMFFTDATDNKETLILSLIICFGLFVSFIGWTISASPQDKIEDGTYSISVRRCEKSGTSRQVVFDSKGKEHSLTKEFMTIYDKDTKVKIYYYKAYKNGIIWENSDKALIEIVKK